MTSEKKGKGSRASYVDPGYLMLTVYTLGVAIFVLFGWFGSANAVSSPEEQDKTTAQYRLLTPNEAQQGELLLPGTEPGKYRAAPMLSMDVDISITGILARTTVTQHFSNDTDQWVEAIYVFPLPDESAVDHLQMQINDRIIIGQKLRLP